MRKKLTFIVPILAVFAFVAIAATITIANSVTNSSPAVVSSLDINTQKLVLLDAISKKDLDKADAAFNLMVTNFAKYNNLDEIVYEAGKEYQYSLRNTEKANQAHNYNLEHFPDTKYGMLSNVEIIRSYIRSGKKTADAEVDLWLSKYSSQPDQAMGAYIIARAYAGNNKEEKAVKLFQYAAAIAPKDIYGMLSQIRYDAATKNYSAADVVADYLIASSPDSEDVKQGISDLADYYRDKKVFANAIHFYQAQIDTWNEYDDQAEPYKKMIYSYIDMNDTASAKSLIDKIQVELAENPKLARANFDIANYYLKTGDAVNALLLHEFNVENYTDSLESLWSQAAQVWYYVRNGDEENAYIKYAEMLAIYANEKTLPKEVFQIGDIYIEVDDSEKARELYQQVLDEWPESEYVFNAKAGFIKADIHDGYDEAAMTGIDNLMAEYKDNKSLPHSVFMFGEQYFEAAMAERSKTHIELVEQSKDNENVYDENLINNSITKKGLENAKSIWSKIIDKLPVSNVTPQAYMFIGEINQYLFLNQDSITYYKEVVDKWPEYEYAWMAQGKIIRLYSKLFIAGTISESEVQSLVNEAQNILVEKFPDCPIADSTKEQIDYRSKLENIQKMSSKDKFVYLMKKSNQGGRK